MQPKYVNPKPRILNSKAGGFTGTQSLGPKDNTRTVSSLGPEMQNSQVPASDTNALEHEIAEVEEAQVLEYEDLGFEDDQVLECEDVGIEEVEGCGHSPAPAEPPHFPLASKLLSHSEEQLLQTIAKAPDPNSATLDPTPQEPAGLGTHKWMMTVGVSTSDPESSSRPPTPPVLEPRNQAGVPEVPEATEVPEVPVLGVGELESQSDVKELETQLGIRRLDAKEVAKVQGQHWV